MPNNLQRLSQTTGWDYSDLLSKKAQEVLKLDHLTTSDLSYIV